MDAGSTGEPALSRGALASRMVGALVAGAVTSFQEAPPASADLGVGEGGLPSGARQFSNLLKVQKDWAALGKTVSEKRSDLSAEEWRNIALFLRKAYQIGGDLEFIAESLSGGKKKEALELIASIKKEIEGADVPVQAQNVDGFLSAQASVGKKFEIFMEMLNDVPSEL